MTDVKQDPVSQDPAEDPATPKPGEKTDPALLLKSLQEERAKLKLTEEEKKEAEAKLKELQDAMASGDTTNEETKILRNQIEELTGKVAVMTQREELSNLQITFPVLKDKNAEFETYRNDPKNKEMSLEAAAKSFLVDNNLLTTPTRKGLENPSGGGRTAQPRGMTFAEAEEIRKTNFRQYSKLLREGKLNDLIE